MCGFLQVTSFKLIQIDWNLNLLFLHRPQSRFNRTSNCCGKRSMQWKRIYIMEQRKRQLHFSVPSVHSWLVYWITDASRDMTFGYWRSSQSSQRLSYFWRRLQRIYGQRTLHTFCMAPSTISRSQSQGMDHLNTSTPMRIGFLIFSFFRSASVASKLQEDSFALIFGINTLVALILQSLLTFVTISWLALNVRVQYQVYAVWYLALAILFAVMAGLKNICGQRDKMSFVSGQNSKKWFRSAVQLLNYL